MWSIIAERELKDHLQSARFLVTATVTMFLLLLSIYLGISHYKTQLGQYEQAVQTNLEALSQQTTWFAAAVTAFRKPDAMEVFVNGVNSDIGRTSDIGQMRNVRLVRSEFSDDPMLAVFQFLDPTFVVLIVLSLIAILFTYNAVNGEKEAGTLKLVFANRLSRASFIMGKLLGSWVALLVPVLLSFLFGALMLIAFGVEMDASHWGRFGLFALASILYFSCFMLFGVLVSAATHRSSVSFLSLLVVWILSVLIVPKAATMLAGQALPVASADEIESRLTSYTAQTRMEFFSGFSKRFTERMRGAQGLSQDKADEYRAQHQEEWQKDDDEKRQQMEQGITDYTTKLYEEFYNQKSRQEQLAFSLAKFSPASMFQLVAMKLAGTDTGLKRRYEEAMKTYREQYTKFVQQKGGGMGGFRISMGRGTKQVFSGPTASTQKIDITEMPRFQQPVYSFGEAVTASLFDLSLLAIFNILAFVGAFVAFLRFDMR
jgi:ABC-type transport system involved in multi-copper enzyme maturation permease subunit